MKRRSKLLRWSWLVLLVLIAVIKYGVRDVRRFKSSLVSIMRKAEDFNNQNLTVKAERWIVVDGTEITNDKLLLIPDVKDWRILVFGEHIQYFNDKRCINCIFFNGNRLTKMNPSSSVMNTKITSYLYAISHGAKWIYVTNHITNLQNQVEDFHFNKTVKGLMYDGQMTFDPDRHFGLKDMSVDHTIRNKHVSYKLSDYITPSIQSKWRPPDNFIGNGFFDVDNVICRLPCAIVPPRLFPATELTGSLVEYRSFWALGSLLGESTSSLAHWWLWLMKDVKEPIGKYPPSCNNMSSLPVKVERYAVQHSEKILDGFQCEPSDNFLACASRLTEAMETQGLLSSAEANLLKSWFDALISLPYKEPERDKSKGKTYEIGVVHKVVLEPNSMTHSEHQAFENPFQGICGASLPVPNSSSFPQIRDILLIVIFNYPSYYSNIVYLDYIYRKYFSNIIYCGSKMNNFGLFQMSYLRPINFLEINELDRGVYGYMCAAYAMEMGFKVKGYLQMSDDVLLNMWNIVDLPRDKIWFQSSIRKGRLTMPKVPNITPVTKQWYWWPWNSRQWGIGRLRELWAHFAILRKKEKSRIDSFLTQLQTSFGTHSGAFYEASDIFYVPGKYKENFSFFSQYNFAHHVFLEIAIPTMLCGFDNISNIVRLNGTYLWYQERPHYRKVFNPKNIFLHPWKVNKLISKTKDKTFFCTKYLPLIEGT